MSKLLFILLASIAQIPLSSQSYTSYYTGNSQNINVNGQGGICLMGGATEDDEAMKWFLRRANGGDVLVLRASGSDGYNDYMYSDLGIAVNSVETIVFNDASAAYNAYVKQKINRAEAIWFAGGDQWDYVTYFRNTPVDSIIRQRKLNNAIAIGGTSAGMAIQGQAYFSAQNGTIYSEEALANPYHASLTVDTALFMQNNYLQNTITDTHFDDPDRKGRLSVFLARMLTDYSMDARAIACDEYTAVCIDEAGIASVYGGWPTYDDNAYFVQINCENADQYPEICTPGSALTWNRNNAALKVYAIQGTSSGERTFDLNTWLNGNGGEWQNWFVQNGVFQETEASAPECLPLLLQNDRNDLVIQLANNQLTVRSSIPLIQIEVLRLNGHVLLSEKLQETKIAHLKLETISNELVFIKITDINGKSSVKKYVVFE